MFTGIHARHYVGKGDELLLFAANQRILLEEGNNFPEQIITAAHGQHVGVVARAFVILPDHPAIKSLSNEVENLDPRHILTNSELRNELKTDSRTGIPLDGYVKATFSINKTCDVGVQSFLLIDRT